MSNEELVILQSDQGALTDEAQLLLAEEIRHRDLSEKRSAISPRRGRIALKPSEEPFRIIIIDNGSLCPACEFCS